MDQNNVTENGDNEFINISEINLEYIDHELLNNANKNKLKKLPIYQIQSNKATDYINIVQVGKFPSLKNVLINKFKLMDNYLCYIVSILYDETTLKENNHQLDMLEVLIIKKNKLIANMKLNFDIQQNSLENNSIMDYISKENTLKIYGFFSLNFHCGNKKIKLKEYKKFPGNIKILDDIIHNLKHPNIVKIIKKM